MHITAGGEQPDQLMQVMLPLIDNEICNQPGWHNNSLDDTMVCAGYEQGRLGNCHVSVPLGRVAVLRVTGVAWSLSLYVCRPVCHDREPCKNGLTDRNAVWVVDPSVPKEPRIRWGPDPHAKGQF